MSSVAQHRYQFATANQWNCGLAHRLACVGGGVQVTPALTAVATRHGPQVATGPAAVTRGGALYWLQYPQTLCWLHRAGDESGSLEVPREIAGASRWVAGSRWLWTHHAHSTELTRFAIDTFAPGEPIRLRDVIVIERCEKLEIVDIAGDGCEGLWLLVSDGRGPLQLAHLTERGQLRSIGVLPYCEGLATAITALKDEVAILHSATQRLLFVRTSDRSKSAEINLASLAPGFECTCIGSDGVSEVTVGGTVPGACGRTIQIYVLRRTAESVDGSDVRALPAAGASGPSAVVRRNDELWVSTATGMWRFGPAVQGDPDEPNALYLTPTLTSPQSTLAKGWLRAELDIDLPPGTTIDLSYGSTSDSNVRDAIEALALDTATPSDTRIAAIDAALGGTLSNLVISFTGNAAEVSRTVSIPLTRPSGSLTAGSNTDLWLWLRVKLSNGAAGPLPTLHQLRVLYPDTSLMQNLPAIFDAEGQVNGFMRNLVGVLETTTQGLDAKIARLGRVIDPMHAPADWLDYLGGWLDLPWDTGLGASQKRAILQAAPALLADGGSRQSLQTFLRCLFPNSRIGITDMAAQVPPAQAGNADCPGSSLPAMLGGWPSGLAVLGDKAVLNCARLACGLASENPALPPPSVLRIDIAATPSEQTATPLSLVSTLLANVVPAESQLRLRWRLPAVAAPIVEDDGTLVLDGPGRNRLGIDSELGYGVLSGTDRLTLTNDGLSTNERLQ